MFKWFYQMKKALQEKISEKGQGMVEYALVLAAVAIIAALVLSDSGGLTDSVNGAYTKAASSITAATDNVGKTTGSGGNQTQTGGGDG